MPLDPKRADLYRAKIMEYQMTLSQLENRLNNITVIEEPPAVSTRNATVSMNQFLRFGIVIGAVTTACNLMATVIRGNTLVAFREEFRARGELSASLRLETQSRLQAIPIIGKLSQAVSESFHQAVGTEYMSRAAGVVEGAIPGLRGAVTGTRVSAAGGGIRERWLGEEERAYQMQLLGIRAGPGAVLKGFREAEQVAITEWQEREKEFRLRGGISGYSPETDVEYQRMEQARKLMEQFRTPQMVGLRTELERGIPLLQKQAREEYVREFGRNLTVANVPAWYSLAAGARPGIAPGEDTQIAQLQTLGTIADLLRDALKGINPAVMAP